MPGGCKCAGARLPIVPRIHELFRNLHIRGDAGALLFPAAAGLVVERGSLLSHSAIVSREMGIPSVVSLGGLCEWVEDGEMIELDGTAGTVRKVVVDG